MIQTIVSSVEVEARSPFIPLMKVGGTVDPSSNNEKGPVIHTINDLLLERATTIPDQPLVGYPASSRGVDDYVYYSAKDLDRFADGAVQNLVHQGLPRHVSYKARISLCWLRIAVFRD
jgi:hypothetical protein